jgi:hypothetical protein
MGCLRNGMGERSERGRDGVDLEMNWNSDMMNGIERNEG